MYYIIFDLEATCWEGNQAGRVQEVIEIGAVRIDAYGRVKDNFQAFVRPVSHPTLSVFCRELTGITQADVDTALPFDIIGNRFMDWITYSDEYMLCSWGNKDKDLLIGECERSGIEPDWLDDYTDLKAEYHRMQKLQKKIGLKKALTREGIDFDGEHHRAYDDAKNLAVLFVKHLDIWGF